MGLIHTNTLNVIRALRKTVQTDFSLSLKMSVSKLTSTVKDYLPMYVFFSSKRAKTPPSALAWTAFFGVKVRTVKPPCRRR